MIPPEHVQDVARAVNEVVGPLARRVRWYDERDLSQRAWEVVLELFDAGGWDPTKGELVPYVAAALRRQLGGELLHDFSPVSTSRGNRTALYGISAASLDVLRPADVSATAPSHTSAGSEGGPRDPLHRSMAVPDPAVTVAPKWADEVLADERWHLRVSALLEEVVGEDGQEGLQALLLDGPRPAASGRPPDHLTRSRAVACVRIAQCERLREMLRERS